jgi:serine/threonine protein kinase
VRRNVADAGYKLNEELDELQPLTTVSNPTASDLQLMSYLLNFPPTIRRATCPRGFSIVLKLLRSSSKEAAILKHLQSIKGPTNHTIPMFDLIHLDIGQKVVILPWKLALHTALQSCNRPPYIWSLCVQFIEAVDFLHQSRVAHCDLKPENVVVDTCRGPPRLFIIDFGLEARVGRRRGSPLRLAPKTVRVNGTAPFWPMGLRTYDPIFREVSSSL